MCALWEPSREAIRFVDQRDRLLARLRARSPAATWRLRSNGSTRRREAEREADQLSIKNRNVEKHAPTPKSRITAAPNQELKSKRHSIQIPSSNYRTRGAMHWR